MGFGPTTIDIFEENAIVCEQEGLSERGPAAAPPR
jgi:hypothetical protein